MSNQQQLFAAFKVAMDQGLAITFTYTNKKGERKERHVLPRDLSLSMANGSATALVLDLTDRGEDGKLKWKRFLLGGIAPEARVVVYDKPPRGYAKDRTENETRRWLTEYANEAVFMEIPAS